MKIGVITDCFKLPLKDGMKLAGELGFDGIQIYATTGEFSPQTLTDSLKDEYKKLLKENNLEISALCGDMGGYGFQIAEDNPERIEKTKQIIDLAVEFGVKVISSWKLLWGKGRLILKNIFRRCVSQGLKDT